MAAADDRATRPNKGGPQNCRLSMGLQSSCDRNAPGIREGTMRAVGSQRPTYCRTLRPNHRLGGIAQCFDRVVGSLHVDKLTLNDRAEIGGDLLCKCFFILFDRMILALLGGIENAVRV